MSDETLALDVLYKDAYFAAIYKPAALSVHAGDLSGDRRVAMRLLRNQLGRRVYPLHRLDRPTAGVLLFALDPESAHLGSTLFSQRQIHKSYLAVVRGYCPSSGLIDHALAATPDAPAKAARTAYQRLAALELPFLVGRYASARYSLVRAFPETGRYHQIRKHFHHISHHLIGDTVHGDGRHNRLFRERFDWQRLCLLAESLAFVHPVTGVEVKIATQGDAHWRSWLMSLPWVSEPDLPASANPLLEA